MFLFSFALYYTTNGLFFTDSTIHKIYEDKGSFNFIYQIPKILYSTLISTFFNIIITFLSLTEILKLKLEKRKIIENSYKIIKCLKIKFIFYFLLSFLFLILFWFYLACFCVVYKNTQIHLIKDTLISFSLSLLYSLFIKLISSAVRFCSLNVRNKNREFFYKINKLF